MHIALLCNHTQKLTLICPFDKMLLWNIGQRDRIEIIDKWEM